MQVNNIPINTTANTTVYANSANSVKQVDSVNTVSKSQESKSNSTTAGVEKKEQAAIYKTSNTNKEKKVYKQDTATIARLKADTNRRTEQLRDLVKKILLKQGETLKDEDMYQLLREGKVTVDVETSNKAKQDISEDGYWGVTQTSDRIVSFAKALTGGDPSKVDEMINAVKKGYEAATKAWGGELPGISKQTLDATLKKLDDWKAEKE